MAETYVMLFMFVKINKKIQMVQGGKTDVTQIISYIVYVSPNISGSQASTGINITTVCTTVS